MLLWCFAAAEAVRGQAGGASTLSQAGGAETGAAKLDGAPVGADKLTWVSAQASGAPREVSSAFVLLCLSSTRLGEQLCAGRVHVHFD